MDAVYPIIILKIIQHIDLLGPMFAFNKQDMILIRTADGFNRLSIKFV